MTRDQIESRLRTLQSMLATETHPSTLATINRCIERLVMADAEDDPRECNACDWVGTVAETVHPKHVPVQMLCPVCNETTT